jgi:hypothetical protein
MKKILIGFLFLLGAAEIIWPILTALRRSAFEPVFARAFDYSKFTEEQQQVFKQFRINAAHDWNVVLILGLATIVIAVLLSVIDDKRKPDA